MKRRIVAFIMVFVMMAALAACGKKGESGEDTSLSYIEEKGTLVLGLDDSFPPMGFRNDNNEIVGFDIDLARAACEKLGVTLVTQPIDWNAKEQELATKNIDCIWNGFSITDERKEQLAMTNAYLTNTIAVVVNQDSGITALSDLSGKRAAIQSGSAAEEALNSEEQKSLKDSLKEVNQFKDYITALMDLESGNSDAVLMDSVVAKYMINENGKNFVILEEYLTADEYGIGFRKGDDALRDAVWNALIELKEDGTVKEISEKWFGEDIALIP